MFFVSFSGNLEYGLLFTIDHHHIEHFYFYRTHEWAWKQTIEGIKSINNFVPV